MPTEFLNRVCPMADGILARLKEERKDGLVGAQNHWQMIIDLRPILFQVSPNRLNIMAAINDIKISVVRPYLQSIRHLESSAYPRSKEATCYIG